MAKTKTSGAVSAKPPVLGEPTSADLSEELRALEQTLPRAGEEENAAEGAGSPAEVPAPSETAPEKETAVEEKTEELFAGKYKTPKELEEGYSNLQEKLTEQGQELGELRKAVGDRSEKTVEEGEASEAKATGAGFWDNPLETIRGVVAQELAPFKGEIRERQVNTDIKEMRTRYQDFDKVVPAISNLLEEHPEYRRIKLEDLYKIVKADVTAETAREEGKKEAYESMEEKQAASAGASTPTKGSKEPEEMTIEEMEEALPKADHFIDHKGQLRKAS